MGAISHSDPAAASAAAAAAAAMLSASTAAAAAVANCHAEQQAPTIPSLHAIHAVHASSSGGGSSCSSEGPAASGKHPNKRKSVAAKLDLKGMPLHALLSLTHTPIALEWATDAAGNPAASAQVVQAAVAAHEKCTDKSCPFCSLDPGSVQQAVLAFKQALESAMKGPGPLPLIEIAQDASTITAAAAAMVNSSNAASALLSGQLSTLSGSGSSALLAGSGGCGSSKANRATAAAAAATSQQLLAKGGWMEVFRGKLGKAAAKLAGSAAIAAASGSVGGSAACSMQDAAQSLTGLLSSNRDLLEVLAVRAAAAGGLVTEADTDDAEGFEDAQEELDTSDSSLGALVSGWGRAYGACNQADMARCEHGERLTGVHVAQGKGNGREQ